MATATSVLALPLMIVAGVAVDFALIAHNRSALQNAADAAALAGARELAIANVMDNTIHEFSKHYVKNNLTKNMLEKKLEIDPKITNDRSELTVNLAYYWEPFLLQYLDADALPIRVSATASLAGSESLCVIALDPTNPSALAMTGKSSITAKDCAIYSNSVSSKGISVVKKARLKSKSTYSGGGYKGPPRSYLPTPVTDSPVIDDPLFSRTPPTAKNCTSKGKKSGTVIKKGRVTLYPGTYCGGLTISGKSKVRLKPGIYIMKDGPLIVSGNATLKGKQVGFYFEGNDAVFDFGVSTQISITAPRKGPLSGILFFESRSSPDHRTFTIRSKDAEKFEGTVYLPKGKLVVDKESRVGQLSDWTAIIANRIEIRKGPKLVINSNYAGSRIPVPDGIGPQGNQARLTK